MSFANDCLETIGTCPNKIKCFSVGQCTEGNLKMTLVDPLSGEVIDLTPVTELPSESSSLSSWPCNNLDEEGNPKHGVEIILKEMYNSPTHIAQMATVSEEDAPLGIIGIPVDHIMSARAGVWLGMAIVWNQGIACKHYPFYFEVTPNLAIYNSTAPLTMYEIRLAIRDVCPEMNFLIDTVEFKCEEIAWALRRPIDYWNEVPPPLAQFTPMNFPYRYHWMEATIAELLKLVATWMRRNDLDYQAAGLTVGDTKKWPDYMRMGQERWQKWEGFVKQKKIEMNLEGAYGSLTGYRTMPYR